MDYVLWYNKCRVNERLVRRLSCVTSFDLVRYVAWYDREPPWWCVQCCSCDTCNGELTFLLVPCSERNMDAALDAGPALVERRRHSNECSYNTFVQYSFAHPSVLDAKALDRMVYHANIVMMYICTTFDAVTATEDISVFKMVLVKNKTPDSWADAERIATRISRATFCRAKMFDTKYVTYLPPIVGQCNALSIQSS